MRARTLILVFLAIILAGGTAFLARNFLARERETIVQEQAPLKVQAPAKSVLVAKVDLKRGQILRPEDGLDRNYVVLGGPPVPARTPESFAGYVARNPITSGEPITDARVIAPGNRGFLAAVLRPGMRAISVPVTITSGIAGFIFPGDQVDLLLTYALPAPPSEGSKPNYDHKAAETVLRNIRVIGIDQRLESKVGEAVPAHTATFEVTPKQSEVIALASEIGKMSLSLRSLAPAPQEVATIEKLVVADAASPNSADPSVGASATYTLDTELSQLLPKIGGAPVPGSERPVAPEAIVVTILRGG